MGNDGGSIPTRRELVRSSARAPTVSELKATALESLAHAWSHCALTDLPIGPGTDAPIASDAAGKLYAYEAVLAALAGAASDPDGGDEGGGAAIADELASLGIRTLRDLVRLHPTPPPNRAGAEEGSSSWVCPLSLKPLAAAARAVYLVPCGHVFAEVALREAGGGADSCPECGAGLAPSPDGDDPIASESVVTILPHTHEDLERVRRRITILQEKGLTHSLKKDRAAEGKKDKKKRKTRDENGADGANGVDGADGMRKAKKKKKTTATDVTDAENGHK